jgi:hypothetical protein
MNTTLFQESFIDKVGLVALVAAAALITLAQIALMVQG